MMTRHFRLIRMARIRISFVHIIAIAIANCHCYCCCQVLASSSRWKNRELVLHVIRLFKELEVSDTEHRNHMLSLIQICQTNQINKTNSKTNPPQTSNNNVAKTVSTSCSIIIMCTHIRTHTCTIVCLLCTFTYMHVGHVYVCSILAHLFSRITV